MVTNRPLLVNMAGALEEHMAYNQNTSQNEAKKAEVEKENASTLMISLSLLVAIGVIILSIIIRNNIMNGVHLIRDGISALCKTKSSNLESIMEREMRSKRLSIVLTAWSIP